MSLVISLACVAKARLNFGVLGWPSNIVIIGVFGWWGSRHGMLERGMTTRSKIWHDESIPYGPWARIELSRAKDHFMDARIALSPTRVHFFEVANRT